MTENGMNSLGLEARHLRLVSEVLQAYVPDRPVWAFGSRAVGRARRWSDLDLAIGGSTQLPFGVRMDLADAFDASLLPIEVDVIDLNDVDSNFRARIAGSFITLQLPTQEVAA